LLFVLFLATSVCSSSGGGGGDVVWSDTSGVPPASGPPVQLAQYCARYVDLACSTATRCDCYAAIGGNEALCRVFLAERCDEDVTDRVEAGDVTFDATRAGQCLAAIERAVKDCALSDQDVALYLASHCEDFLIGARHAGEPCDDDDACVPPLECRDDVCTALPGPGEACLDGYDCADEAYCDDDRVCRTYVGPGGACAGRDWVCDDDLYCDSRGDTCQPYLRAGQPCDHASWACDDDLHCVEATRVCARYPGVGAPCTADGFCDDDLWCDADDRCRQLLADGLACDDDEQCASDDCDEGTCGDTVSEVCDAL